MRITTLAFVCALLGACASSDEGGSSGDGNPTPDAAVSNNPVCGDSVCAATEIGKCNQDCGGMTNPVCGNTTCENGETTASCPGDCAMGGGAVCGNGTCQTGETMATCPGDCSTGGNAVCGNGTCEMAAGENSSNCAGDCSASTSCPADPFECIFCLLDPTLCPVGHTPTTCAAC